MKYRSILEETDWMENLTKENDAPMKKIIVPVDFSDVSKNAARYAANMSADIPDSEILLYHVYDKHVFGADGSPMTNEGNSMKVIADSALHNLRNEILPLSKSTMGILSEPGNLAENLEKLVLRNGADLVIMGINGATKMEKVLIGSNTLSIIKKDSFPVLIIPPNATYDRIQRVVFASDFKKVASTTPVNALRNVLSIFRPEVHVLHIDEDREVHMGEDFKKEKNAMDALLSGFNHEYSFLETSNFIGGISQYVKDKHANLIITVPHHHSFLSELFKTTHTEKLAYHTEVPVLAIHQ